MGLYGLAGFFLTHPLIQHLDGYGLGDSHELVDYLGKTEKGNKASLSTGARRGTSPSPARLPCGAVGPCLPGRRSPSVPTHISPTAHAAVAA